MSPSNSGRGFERSGNRNVRQNLKNYLFQSLLTFLCIGAALLLYGLFGGFIVASLGASSFIIFITPHAEGARSRYVIGGYICGCIAGILFSFLFSALHKYMPDFYFHGVDYTQVLVCAAASALTTLLMATTGFVHPPAAALALGLAIDTDCLKTAAAALIGVLILCAARRVLRKFIKNLV